MTPIRVHVPYDLLRDCWAFAERSVAGYARGEKSTRQSTHGIERSVRRQAAAKAAECAVALWAWRDPRKVLDWSSRPDRGHDIVLAGSKIDVKQISAYARLLFWPGNKRADLPGKDFDLFVLVKGDLDTGWFSIMGWMSKPEFMATARVAGPGHKLAEGDLYVDQAELQPMWAPSLEGADCSS